MTKAGMSFVKKVRTLTHSIIFQKAEAKKAQEQLEALKRESHAEMTKTREEIESLRKSVEAKTEEISDKIKTLNQVFSSSHFCFGIVHSCVLKTLIALPTDPVL